MPHCGLEAERAGAEVVCRGVVGQLEVFQSVQMDSLDAGMYTQVTAQRIGSTGRTRPA